MGLFDNNVVNRPTYNNTLKINACSGGIYKTYKESWFTKFNLNSDLAEKLFKPYDNEISTSRGTYDMDYHIYIENAEPVIILQMVMCGDMEVIAEVIREEDFNKYFEIGANENDLENKGE